MYVWSPGLSASPSTCGAQTEVASWLSGPTIAFVLSVGAAGVVHASSAYVPAFCLSAPGESSSVVTISVVNVSGCEDDGVSDAPSLPWTVTTFLMHEVTPAGQAAAVPAAGVCQTRTSVRTPFGSSVPRSQLTSSVDPATFVVVPGHTSFFNVDFSVSGRESGSPPSGTVVVGDGSRTTTLFHGFWPTFVTVSLMAMFWL